MLTIQKSKSHQGNCTPNVLPCRINHSGPVDISKRYWDPSSRDNKKVSYFRGRKLYARRLQLPKGFKGVVCVDTDRILPRKVEEKGGHGEEDEEEDGEEEEKEVETKVMEEVGSFEAVEVWGHESVMDEADPYVRGVEEWIGFSAAIHGFGEDKK